MARWISREIFPDFDATILTGAARRSDLKTTDRSGCEACERRLIIVCGVIRGGPEFKNRFGDMTAKGSRSNDICNFINPMEFIIS